MRMKRWSIGLIVLATLVGWGAYAQADVGATVDPGYAGFIAGINADLSDPTHTDYQTIGWRFFVDKPIVVTHLGLFDYGDNGLSCAHKMGIWRVKKEGGLQLERQVDIGPGGVTEGHHVWVALAEPFTINPDPVPYVINGVEYYERWLIGAWTGSGNTEELVLYPLDAVTLNAQQAGVIRLQNYSFRLNVGEFPGPAPYYGAPWGSTIDYYYFGVNFKYSLLGPAANAGPDVAIYTSQQTLTTLTGTATHSVPGTAMQYRWLEGGMVLQDWADVGANGEANLSLAAPVAAFSIGDHTLTLEVKDAALTVSDTMTLTLHNTPPEGQVTPVDQVVEIGVDAIIITAEVADFDGDALTYQWVKGGEVLQSGTVTAPHGGGAISIDDLTLAAGDPRFPLGTHQVDLVVSDGTNPPVTVSATVKVKDSTAPTVAPTASTTLLWPPNHQLVPVTIWANAADNGGGLITLTVSVESDEPDCSWCHRRCGHHCGHWQVADWYIDSINNDTGVIQLRLRSERFAWGDGRVYTITITATDETGNSSDATVEVRVPHDKRRR